MKFLKRKTFSLYNSQILGIISFFLLLSVYAIQVFSIVYLLDADFIYDL